MKVFVTGGAGYIGSHTIVLLLASGHDVVLYDNLVNAKPEVLNRIEKITGKTPVFIQNDVRDRSALSTAFEKTEPDAVIHFAGLKSVAESTQAPLSYYDTNVVGTLCLLEVMRDQGVSNLIFSSSATVYGTPVFLPYTEDHPLAPENPYGATKLASERLIADYQKADPSFRAGILRYFNPIGAHESGLIGEDPSGIPNNLLPYVAQVAIGRRPFVNVWGNDYPTPDGTGVRDYIHVMDLAQGHLAALEKLAGGTESFTVNLGTGKGYSVLDVVHAFEKASGRPIPTQIAPRRAGDIAAFYADATHAKQLLGWQAARDLEAMCADSWRWQSKNPDGY